MKNVKALFKKIVLGIGLILIAWATYPIYRELFLIFANYPVYLWFDYQANQINSRFDSLNDEVYKILPEPLNFADLKERKIIGTHFLATKYGRELQLDYELKVPTHIKSVVDYYKIHLALNKWILKGENPGEAVFMKETSCIYIDTLPIGNRTDQFNMTDYYRISIYHDFIKQNFSPKFPDFPTIRGFNAFSLYTMGEATFILCGSNFEPPIKK
jgi:hypothetical protein